MPTDSTAKGHRPQKVVPNPTKATWLALVIPGGGQFTTASIGNCPSSMEDLPVVPMPLREQQDV